ncbi:MAG: hypothetical protein FWG93_02925 [Oscillospiraceae bacterium]|nr:hypothetical protein [Oscillospiraceae bacterium]
MKFIHHLKNPEIRNAAMLAALFLAMLLILFTVTRESERRAREAPYGTPRPEVTLPAPPAR